MKASTGAFSVVALAAVAAAALGACGLVYDADALDHAAGASDDGGREANAPPTDTGPSDDAGTDEAATTADCPATTRGPRMVRADGQCIDATEVTVADYEAFRNDEATLLPFASPCKWLRTLTPTTFEEQRKTPQRPVVDVSWCHAFGYCAWAGKRLCGRVSGGALPPGDAGVDPRDNQWVRACTKGGTQAYAYGASVAPRACTNDDRVDVGTRGACQGPYPGLHDMLGNVGEWIDACTDDGSSDERDGCTALGFERIRDELSCYDAIELSRYWTESDLGFRCCEK